MESNYLKGDASHTFIMRKIKISVREMKQSGTWRKYTVKFTPLIKI